MERYESAIKVVKASDATIFDRLTDLSVTVHVSRKTQLERLMARNQIGRAGAEAWLALQLAEDERMQRADLWIDNEASK